MKLLPALWTWLESDTRKVEIHGWTKYAKKVNGKSWRCRILDVRMIAQPNGTVSPEVFERDMHSSQ